LQTLASDGQPATADVCHTGWDGLAGIPQGTTPPGPRPGRHGQGNQIMRFTATLAQQYPEEATRHSSEAEPSPDQLGCQ
jgi:hypothetical protein